MQNQKAGQIINVSSVNGHKKVSGIAIFSATKGAVITLSEGLRMEVKPYNIRTMVILPEAIATELRDCIFDKKLIANISARFKDIEIPVNSFAQVVSFLPSANPNTSISMRYCSAP